ncbi:MAG: Membrane-bound lytic murein transglycosylase C [Rhodocyclaceae bacterium]|nr:transglycosylase SLT domain-containing protein [Zoogloeaceae bacterium]MBV6408153.1 Membrane-bound lytic murein transglycosylase C [Rhodocyclaceae bacterium]MCK6382967.1 lytic transglycosylase domain-containing protein [Rhodocyclaceae bacterium]CAG0933015.1 membrane-bound lytic murein transglycosylase E [Rhodocyclaceae bacterium]
MRGIEVRKFAKETASFLMHFAHGGLLVTGIIVTVFLFAHIGAAESHEQGLQGIGDMVVEHRGQQTAVDASERIVPSGEMRGVVEYLARKYRVAATAIEPLVTTARSAGLRAGVDPMLIIAVMAIESGFNPIAESPMGAQGLMQIIPRYHQDKLGKISGDSLLDPAANIHVGAMILEEYIRRCGSLEEGLQMYAGAASDEAGLYAAKVLAEKQRIESAVRRGRQSSV